MKRYYMYYEDIRPRKLSLRKLFRRFTKDVDDGQKRQGTTFPTWLDEMVRMQILIPVISGERRRNHT